MTNAIQVVFFRLASGKEPVREWLKSMSHTDRKIIGENIKTLQYGWPIGMPLARKMGDGLWELRSTLANRIARTFFTFYEGRIVLLHGFIKKSQATPIKEREIAKRRLGILRGPDA